MDVPPCTRFVNGDLKTGSLSETEAPSGAPSEQNRISIVVLADRLFKGRRPNFDFSFYWSNPNCDLQQQVFFLAKYTHGDKFQLNIYIGIEYILPKIYDIWRVSKRIIKI